MKRGAAGQQAVKARALRTQRPTFDKGVTVIRHPLVQHNLTLLRNRRTKPQEFRRVLGEMAALMLYEATRSFQVEAVQVCTPLAMARGARLKREVILVPILRAGLGMLESILQLVPHARVGLIGLKREETTLEATFYHKSLPADLRESEVILIDPMLATGGSAVAALELLNHSQARQVRMVNVVAAPQGIRRVHASFPRLRIFTAAIDPKLNEQAYIVPGLGDAGDRVFGV